ncbi:IS3 family transposase [Geomonas sp. Red276]
MTYTEGFKANMVRRMAGPNAISATALAREVGVPQQSLSRWLRDASVATQPDSSSAHPESVMPPKRPQDRSAEEKLKIVTEAEMIPEEQLGAFLRRNGIHEAQLREWRSMMLSGLQKPPRSTKNSEEAKKIQQLEKELQRKEKALAEAAAIIILKKKGPVDLGGRGRAHGQEERQMIRQLIEEATNSGARLEAAAEAIGLSIRTLQRWDLQGDGADRRRGPISTPANKLDPAERQNILDVANSPEFRDLSPKQIVPQLADQGSYVASESSFYRVLREEGQIKHREPSRPATGRKTKEHVATGPNQVWSWDITYLKSPIVGQFFYLYLIMDIWSRKIVAATVFAKESNDYSAWLFLQACRRLKIDPAGLVLHSDNGGPMKGATMLATLQRLGVVPSFSRPQVSDDNPYSESLFRTMKYRPGYPSKPFESIEAAQTWVDGFTSWYNTEHLHSGIRFVTPDDRHFGREKAILDSRRDLYEKARQQNPARWSKGIRNWDPVGAVFLNPEPAPEIILAAA